MCLSYYVKHNYKYLGIGCLSTQNTNVELEEIIDQSRNAYASILGYYYQFKLTFYHLLKDLNNPEIADKVEYAI